MGWLRMMEVEGMSRGSVDYELVVYEELPPARPRRGPRSVLDGQLEVIRATPEAWGKPVRVGLYRSDTAASQAKRILVDRWQAEGCWLFVTRPVPASKGREGGRGVFAVYTPPEGS